MVPTVPEPPFEAAMAPSCTACKADTLANSRFCHMCGVAVGMAHGGYSIVEPSILPADLQAVKKPSPGGVAPKPCFLEMILSPSALWDVS